MTKRILKGAATVASLPVWIVGNALMVPLLKRQLRRETQRADNLAHERNHLDGQAEAMRRERDEAQRKLNLANATVCEQIEALRERDAESAALHQSIERLIGDKRRARKWSSLWHGVARRYRRERFEQAEERHRARINWSMTCGKLGRSEQARKEAEGQLEALKARLAEVEAAHDGAAAEYQTLQSEVAATHAVLDRTTAAKGTTLADRVRQHVELYENAIGVYRDDLRKVEGQLEALRSAVRDQIADCAQAARDGLAGWFVATNMSDALERALSDGTPPVQDAPPTNDEARAHMRSMSEPFFSARRRAAVEGDHPAGDPVTQQWAGIVEDMQRKRDEDTRRLEAAWRERDTLRVALAAAEELIHPWYGPCDSLKNGKCSECARLIVFRESGDDMVLRLRQERDTLRREVDALKKELADADRDHDAALAETRARHRRNLAEALRCKDASWPELLAEVHKLRRKAEGKS